MGNNSFIFYDGKIIKYKDINYNNISLKEARNYHQTITKFLKECVKKGKGRFSEGEISEISFAQQKLSKRIEELEQIEGLEGNEPQL